MLIKCGFCQKILVHYKSYYLGHYYWCPNHKFDFMKHYLNFSESLIFRFNGYNLLLKYFINLNDLDIFKIVKCNYFFPKLLHLKSYEDYELISSINNITLDFSDMNKLKNKILTMTIL